MALISPRFKSSATLNRVAANVARLQTGLLGRAVQTAPKRVNRSIPPFSGRGVFDGRTN